MFKLKMENMRREWCKGCGYCADVCPKKALHLGEEQNKQGYNMIVLDEALCIGCGTCRLVCPDSVFVFVKE